MITFRPDIYFISFSTLATPQNQNPKVIIIGRWVGETGAGHPGDDDDRSAAQIGDWPERICTSEFRVGNPDKRPDALRKKTVPSLPKAAIDFKTCKKFVNDKFLNKQTTFLVI